MKFLFYAVLAVFSVLECKISLCVQIEEIRFVFRAIKTRPISRSWKLVTVSGPAILVSGAQCRPGSVQIIFTF